MSMAVGLIVHADQAEQILQEGRAGPHRSGRESCFIIPIGRWTPPRNWGVDRQFGSVPPPQAYWLAKARANRSRNVVPSTFMKGMNVG